MYVYADKKSTILNMQHRSIPNDILSHGPFSLQDILSKFSDKIASWNAEK